MGEFILGHRKSLDGARGLAILLVLLSHVPSLPLGGGFIGVDLFFVLSGFLITTLLLEEQRTTGAVSLKAFYARRALRLLPALVVMLVALGAIAALTEPPETAARIRAASLMTLLYSSNWFIAFKAYPSEVLAPAWSLSVEEQFYIVWPLLLIGLLRLRASTSTKAMLVFAGLLLSAGLRALLWRTTGSFERVFFGSDTHADGLLAGSLVGLLLSQGVAPPVRPLRIAAYLVLGVLPLFVWWCWPSDAWVLSGGLLAMNLGIAALVACLVLDPDPLLRGLFEFAPLTWLGRISYGVYLWHMVLFGEGKRLPLLQSAGSWPLTIAATVAVAALSWYGLERPLLGLKRRFERIPRAAR